MITAILDFYRNDPLVAWTLTIGVGSLLILAIYVVWLAHEERKEDKRQAEAQRRRILAAAHRIPRPFSEKASQGFDRRVS